MKRIVFLFFLIITVFNGNAQDFFSLRGKQHLLTPDPHSRFYILPDPEECSGQSLLLDYTATSHGLIRIDISDGSSHDFSLIKGSHRHVLSLPNISDAKLTGIKFLPEGDWDSVYLRSVYLSQIIPQGATLISKEWSTELKISSSDYGWALNVSAPEGVIREKGKVYFSDSLGKEEGFEILLNQGSNPVYFYHHELSIEPVSCRIEIPDEHLLISFLSIDIPDSEPLPADINTVLMWPVDNWRSPDFEIFRWSRFENVYIGLFKNQPTQSSYLKRLCFHQEKKWARGQILNDDALSKRRGWNAHDYGADGIAEFYTQAEEEDFPLGEGDLKFRQLAMDLGLISKNSNGGYVSNGGAFISLQQERPYSARKFYLAHEGAHGIFFTHPDFEEYINTLWEEQTEEAQFVWKSFLWKYSYDAEYEYLVVNEFQAYLIQKHRSSADWYFNNRWRKLFENHGDYGRIDSFLSDNPEYFNITAKKVENYIAEHYGFITGDLGMIRRLEE